MTLRRFTAIAATTVAATLWSGCAIVPKSIDTTPSVLELRKDYARDHPGGRWVPLIQVGEVARGMGFGEVYASWGMPATRIKTTNKKSKPVEYWAYTERDDGSGDWTVYTFAFEKNTLVSWNVDRHVVKNVALTPDDLLRRHPTVPQDPRPAFRRGLWRHK